jgi:fused signal recognition particle receptor
MKGWIKALARTREHLTGGLAGCRGKVARVSDAEIEEWEAALVTADIPARLACEWAEQLRGTTSATSSETISSLIEREFADADTFQWTVDEPPMVLLLVGVNGSGKTTTAAKLARQASQNGLRPLLAAADTFRAAGTDQLELWSERVGCPVVSGVRGGDAAAVAFDAVEAARARGADVVIIDTAGRMHTRQPLMDELSKICRSIAKAAPGAPHECWIVLDASLGNNAVAQARVFHETIRLTGAVVSKLDGSSKAGFLLGLARDVQIPVRFAGLGEGMDDLVPFDARSFAGAIVANG